MIPDKILAEETRKTPGKILAGPPGKTLAKGISGATARPAPTKSPPLFTCSCQPSQLGRHLRGDM